jgi:adenosylcobinamide-phosphate synthase
VAGCLLLVPLVWLTSALAAIPLLGWALSVGFLVLALGGQSLRQHALEVEAALADGDLDRARQKVGRMVSRDSEALDAEQISKATIESVLENGCDAVFGALFWYLVAGAPGVVLYRLANTLDAMWGYRNERYLHFGWGAARLDDLLNWVPAQLTALGYAAVGATREALRSWYRQGGGWKSRNAGVVMASGASALGLCLGGRAPYEGRLCERPQLGEGAPAEPKDISRALELLDRALLLWLALILIADWVFD